MHREAALLADSERTRSVAFQASQRDMQFVRLLDPPERVSATDRLDRLPGLLGGRRRSRALHEVGYLMTWHDDIEQMEADDRAALRFWETPEEQACGNSES